MDGQTEVAVSGTSSDTSMTTTADPATAAGIQTEMDKRFDPASYEPVWQRRWA